MQRVWFAALLVVSLSPLAVTAQDKEHYSIKLAEPEKGAQLSSEFNIRQSFTVQQRNIAGQLVRDDLNVFGARFASDASLLEVAPKNSRFRQHYRTFRVTIDGDTKVDAAEGKTFLVLEKDGKKEVLTEKGEPLLPEEREKMEKAISQQSTCGATQDELTPPKPVAIGESWPVPSAASWIKRNDAEVAFTSATAQLRTVYHKDGRLYGVIELRAEGAVKSLTIQGRKMALKPGSKMVLKSTLDGCIDGSSPARAETFSLIASLVLQNSTPDGLTATMSQSWEMSGSKTIR